MNQTWGILACVGAGVLAFLTYFTIFQHNSKRSDNPTPSPVASSAPEPEKPPKTEVSRNPSPKNSTPPKPPAPTKVILQRWDLGGNPWKENERRRVYVNASGTKAVTQTDTEIVCWDLLSFQRVQTFKPEGKAMYVAPDASTVATVSKDSRRVVLRDAATGRQIGAYEPRGGGEILLHEHEPAFSPAGDFLCLCVKEKAKNAREAIAAVSTRTGVGKIVNLPREWFDTTGHQWRILMPWPAQNVFLRNLVAHPCCVMNLKDGINTRVDSLSIGPDSRPGTRSCKLSPDGRYLLARTPSQLRIIDWKADRIVLKHNMPLLVDDWFTPDSQRFLSLRVPDRLNALDREVGTPPGGWLQLTEITQIIDTDVSRSPRGKLLAEFIMDRNELKGLADLAFLMGGKQMLMLDRGTSAAIVDFEAAFRVSPLPAGPQPPAPETLPLR